MIKIENLLKTYVINQKQNKVALNGINLEIKDGEFVALLGPSGCGKTTTLMILAGILKPTSGNIYFGDKIVNHVEPKDRNIGMVFQSYALYPHLSVRDNIAFPLKQQKMPKSERYKRVEKVAKSVQLSELLDRKPTQLSGGQQQRVAMARALCKEPEYLLLDEPMSNLDTRLKLDVRDQIRTLQQRLNLTTIIVTHDQEEAMAIADRIAILDQGVIQQFGTPKELYQNPANLFVANFLGNPPMNIIRGNLERDGDFYKIVSNFSKIKVFRKDKSLNKYLQKKIALGIRPAEIMPCDTNDKEAQFFDVTLVEHLGDRILVKMENSNEGEESYLRMICSNIYPIRIGDRIPVKLKIESISLFDLEKNGKNIFIN
jgi:inositol-phosphate transport system ATP-binding protein